MGDPISPQDPQNLYAEKIQLPAVTYQKSSSRTFLIIIGISVLASAIGYLGYQNWQLKDQVNRLDRIVQVDNTPSSSSSPTPLPYSTANWKTYSDPNKVYEFKYPSNYSLGHYAGDNSPILLNNRIDWGITQHPAGECKGDCPVIINKRDTSINGYQVTVYNGWVGSVGGETPQSFIKYEIREPGARGIEGPNTFVVTLWELDRRSAMQKNYSSTRNPGIINKDDQDTFDQILSTFRFEDTTQQKITIAPTPRDSDVPQGWKTHEFSTLGLTIFAPNDWKSSAQKFSDTSSSLIKFWKVSSPDIIPIQMEIKSDWSNTGDTQYYAKNYTVAGSIPAVRIDPPRKEEKQQERYQTNVYFEYRGNVYVFQCVHNWTQDYLDTCNTMLSTMKLQ